VKSSFEVASVMLDSYKLAIDKPFGDLASQRRLKDNVDSYL